MCRKTTLTTKITSRIRATTTSVHAGLLKSHPAGSGNTEGYVEKVAFESVPLKLNILSFTARNEAVASQFVQFTTGTDNKGLPRLPSRPAVRPDAGLQAVSESGKRLLET